jgi:biofilm PGA synthesis lipoprotein PgaB
VSLLGVLGSVAADAAEHNPMAEADHAVILAYHHVSTATPASTSVTPAQFDAHLDYIFDHGYVVWPLNTLLNKLRAGQSVPDNAIALTFDDAYESVFETVQPKMQARGWPYTVFVNSAAIDAKHAPYMSWQQLRKLVTQGVDIGNHSHGHAHLVQRLPNESEDSWRTRVSIDIEHAQTRLEQELGNTPELFAYPYGEYSDALTAEVTRLGMFGIGQHSGAVGHHSKFSALPRFPVSGSYASLDQLATRLQAEPLNITASPPGPMILPPAVEAPMVRLVLADGAYEVANLACYASGQGRMQQVLIESKPPTFQIKPVAALRPGRSKYNCTIPHQSKPGVYFWWSYLVMKPKLDGSWYAD